MYLPICQVRKTFQSSNCPAIKINCDACIKCELIEKYNEASKNYEISVPGSKTEEKYLNIMDKTNEKLVNYGIYLN